jgi:hypothetical protein
LPLKKSYLSLMLQVGVVDALLDHGYSLPASSAPLPLCCLPKTAPYEADLPRMSLPGTSFACELPCGTAANLETYQVELLGSTKRFVGIALCRC